MSHDKIVTMLRSNYKIGLQFAKEIAELTNGNENLAKNAAEKFKSGWTKERVLSRLRDLN